MPDRVLPTKLSTRQRAALRLLRDCEGYDNGWGVVTSGSTARIDGQPWVHWLTARALKTRGLVEFDVVDPDNPLLKLTREGHRVAL